MDHGPALLGKGARMNNIEEFIRLFECWEEGLSYEDFYIDINNAIEDAKASRREAQFTPDKYYITGWNAALDMAAVKLQADFRQAFGADTCASWAAWLKEQKK